MKLKTVAIAAAALALAVGMTACGGSASTAASSTASSAAASSEAASSEAASSEAEAASAEYTVYNTTGAFFLLTNVRGCSYFWGASKAIAVAPAAASTLFREMGATS